MNQVANQVTLIGRLGTGPELFGDGDRAGAKFDIATSEVYGRGEEKKERVDWHRIVCWGGLAQTCRHLAKGDQVAVFGKLRTNRWEDADGRARRSVEVVASDVGFLRVKSFAAADAE